MRNLQLVVLQNPYGGPRPRPSLTVDVPVYAPRTLTPHETDALLSQSMWSRPLPRVLKDFEDSSGVFRPFRIY